MNNMLLSTTDKTAVVTETPTTLTATPTTATTSATTDIYICIYKPRGKCDNVKQKQQLLHDRSKTCICINERCFQPLGFIKLT